MSEEMETCPGCGGDAGDNFFDRSICPCDDVMHTRCAQCGFALDNCEYDQAMLDFYDKCPAGCWDAASCVGACDA